MRRRAENPEAEFWKTLGRLAERVVENMGSPPPTAAPSANLWTYEETLLFRELVDAGYTALAKKYHPDRGGDPARMQLLNRLRDKLQGGQS